MILLSEWQDAIKRNKKNLKSTKFEDVIIEIKAGQDYQEKLDAIMSPNQRVYPIENLEKKFISIKDNNVDCYIGFLNLKEIQHLLTNEDGDLDDIFFDNIRYFSGLAENDGSVNAKIYSSLEKNQEVFHTLHNGITITAHSKHYNQAKDLFEIQAFSVINGCQTCNLIWMWITSKILLINQIEDKEKREQSFVELNDRLLKIKVPVKIVISGNTELRAKITESANTQNEVDSIQLIAVSEQARSIEKLFNKETRDGEIIYYERLAKQYPEIGKAYKITTEDIFRAFYSSFHKVPHKLTVGYGSFEKEKIKIKDFYGNLKYDNNAYYISALLFNYLERYLKSQYPFLISLRHHLLLLLSVSIDREFEKNGPEKVSHQFLTSAKLLISDRQLFNDRVANICEIVINKCDYFIDKSGEKPKVRAKSYYTLEGTEKMVTTFINEFFETP